MNKTGRLFIAADLPPQTKNALAEMASRMKKDIRANFSGAQNYHITLAFLGETPFDLTDGIGRIIAGAAEGIGSFDVRLGAPGYFGREDNAVLWCGMEGAEPLFPLSEGIRAGLERAGIPFDPKPMKPHITLARKARLNGVDLNAYAIKKPVATIDSVSLYLSHRVNGELTYTQIIKPVRLRPSPTV